MRVGAAAKAVEKRKHTANDPKCAELGSDWVCVPLAVETYCNWGKEARRTFALLATRLAFGSSCHKARVVSDMFGRLNITLVRAIQGPYWPGMWSLLTLIKQVNQKLLYRESDWWYVRLVVQKARKQGTVC